MRAPRELVDTRRIAATLATGVVVTMTAMTAGIAPALAAPGGGGGPGGGGSGPVTTVAPAPAPARQAPAEQAPAQQAPAPAQAPVQQAPVQAPPPQAPAQQAPPVQQAPVQQAPAVEAPPAAEPKQTQAPKSTAGAPPVSATQPTTQPSTQPTVKAPTTTATTVAPSPSRQAVPSTTPPASTTAPAVTPEQRTPGRRPSESRVTESASPEPNQSDATSSAPKPAPGEVPAAGSSAPTTGPSDAPSTSDATRPTESTAPAESSSPESGRRSRPSEQTASSSVSQAARAIERSEPETLTAPAEDVQIAKTAKVVELPQPLPAPKEDVDAIAKLIDLPSVPKDLPGVDRVRDAARIDDNRDGRNRDGRNDDVRLAGAWDRNVRQWSPDWVSYDDYYRPVLSNPYRDPVRIVYVYENRPRIAYIPPLSRIVLEVAQYAAYSFTAIVQNAISTVVNTAIDTAVNVAVGSFFGGGFFPGIGLPLPPPPPPVLRYDNVPVFVNYSQAQYEPFRVQRVVDVGDDAQYGERKVLLDGVTPAWGEWNQSPTGERQFEVHRTQQFPGLDQPSEAPLPGDYQLRLLSDESKSSGLSRRDVYLLSAAGLCAMLSIGAVLVAMRMGRRRRI